MDDRLTIALINPKSGIDDEAIPRLCRIANYLPKSMLSAAAATGS